MEDRRRKAAVTANMVRKRWPVGICSFPAELWHASHGVSRPAIEGRGPTGVRADRFYIYDRRPDDLARRTGLNNQSSISVQAAMSISLETFNSGALPCNEVRAFRL